MIPKKTLFETINKFDEKYKKLNEEVGKIAKLPEEEREKVPTDLWLEKFQKWRDMQDSWRKLQDAVEFELLPYVEEE